MKIIDQNLIINLQEKYSKNQILELIANSLVKNKYINNPKQLLINLKKRELEFSTGLGEGIAIPHATVDDLIEPKLIIIRSEQDIKWGSLDDKPINLIISIIVPSKKRNDHFEILTKLSANLIDKKVVNKFKYLPAKELELFVNQLLFKKDENFKSKISNNNLKNVNNYEKNNQQLQIVGVTTCPTGVAHTFMAAKALEDEGKKRGWKIKIEKQGQMTKDKLSQLEIDQADYVIFAIGKGIDDLERFDGKKIYEVDVAKPITKAKEVLDDLITNAKAINPKQKSQNTVISTGKTEKKSFNQGAIRHLLSGISYMIPFIAMAGIVLGFTTAFGFDSGWISDESGLIVNTFGPDWTGNTEGLHYGFGPTSTGARAINFVASAGFTLFIPVLGGYIAYSIAGRHALAPAMIISFVLNDGSGTALFNYETGGFGDLNSAALGFFGAIAAGYLIGYGINWFTKYTDKINSQAFQTIVPLLIIPIVWTMIPWVFFAFIGYLPLYYLAIGLQQGIEALVDINLLWLVGMILGAMICFDLGGPVNKIAMVTAAAFLTPGSSYLPLLNGVAAVAVSIPPMILLLTAYAGVLVGFKMDEEDKINATSAGVMGFFGITEGSIPFAAKNPKVYMPSFMIAGAIAGAIAIPLGVGNSIALWGGPIIYLAGGMGKSPEIGGQIMQTDYVYAALYFIPLIIGAIVGMFSIAILSKIYSKSNQIRKK